MIGSHVVLTQKRDYHQCLFVNLSPPFFRGATTGTIFNACDLQFDLGYAMKRDAGSAGLAFLAAFAQPLRLLVQCILIQLPKSLFLVDAEQNHRRRLPWPASIQHEDVLLIATHIRGTVPQCV